MDATALVVHIHFFSFIGLLSGTCTHSALQLFFSLEMQSSNRFYKTFELRFHKSSQFIFHFHSISKRKTNKNNKNKRGSIHPVLLLPCTTIPPSYHSFCRSVLECRINLVVLIRHFYSPMSTCVRSYSTNTSRLLTCYYTLSYRTI